MSRPCLCDKCNKNGIYELNQCRLCWLYYNDNRYKQKWDFPTKINQLTNFVKSIAKKINSPKNVSKEIFNNRLKICGECPNKTKDWRCTLCGCYLTVKAKWSSEECLIGKWSLPIVEETTKKNGCGCGNK